MISCWSSFFSPVILSDIISEHFITWRLNRRSNTPVHVSHVKRGFHTMSVRWVRRWETFVLIPVKTWNKTSKKAQVVVEVIYRTILFWYEYEARSKSWQKKTKTYVGSSTSRCPLTSGHALCMTETNMVLTKWPAFYVIDDMLQFIAADKESLATWSPWPSSCVALSKHLHG